MPAEGREILLTNLKSLTVDSIYVTPEGQIKIKQTYTSGAAKRGIKPHGSKLLSDIIGNENRRVTFVDYQYDPSADSLGTSSETSPENRDFKNAANGIGTDAVIGFSWNVIGKVPTESATNPKGMKC